MRHITSWFLGAALAFGLALSAQAQQNQPNPTDPSDQLDQPSQQMLSGRIVAKDDATHSFTIQSDEGQKLGFRVNNTTQFRSGQGQSAELNDLKLGDRVMVEAQPAAPGSKDRLATRVVVQPRAEKGQMPSTQSPHSMPDTSGEPH